MPRRPSPTNHLKRLKGLSRELERLQIEAEQLSTLITDLLSTMEREQSDQPNAPRRKPRKK